MTWLTAAAEEIHLRSSVVVSFVDVFTDAPPITPPDVSLEVWVQVVDRNGGGVVDSLEAAVGRFVALGFRPSWTPSRRLVFSALDRRPDPGPPLRPSRFRLAISRDGIIPHPSDLEFDAPAVDGTIVTRVVRIYPGPDFRFPTHVPTVRGRVLPPRPAGSLEVLVSPPAIGRFASSERCLVDPSGHFTLGLRTTPVDRPFVLDVRDPITDTSLGTHTVRDITTSIDIDL